MGRRLILFVVALGLFACIVGGAAVYALVRDSRSLSPSAIAQAEGMATAVPGQPTRGSAGQLPNPLAVPFPDGSLDHSFFALSGGHQPVECAACHATGDYQGTDPDCAACHAQDDPHAGEYGLACANCHVIEGWQFATFDHSAIGSTDCSACHAPPPDHYPGACAACHTDTTDFRIVANFDHSTIGSTDCSACHAPPPDHYPGACAACHTDTTDFRIVVNFDHTTIGSTDCSACHTPPANHYQGACAACHTDTNNFRNVTFNHSTIGSTDCAACHAPPANHFPGSCRNCHGDVNNFRNVNFNHAGLTDCQSCHTPPANHYPGQCSACHTTNSWQGASFNHTFPINHEGANGNCSTCHPGGNTAVYTCATCHNQQEMNEEHDDVSGFTGNNCVQCHADGREHDDDDDDDD
ncbi:MAG: hypothetical protein IPM39_18960 [Chloroflexi bacterium]|nr:hypothetical protein [Chloroflexota bacterium]